MLASSVAFAKENKTPYVPFFTDGEWVLRSGKESDCPDGEVRTYNDGRPKLAIGGLYIFDLRNFKQSLPDDMEPEAKCVYHSEDKMDMMSDATVITYEEVLKCGEQTRHALTRRLTIKKDFINLAVSQVGEPAMDYSCSWMLTKRKVNSVSPKASKKK